ncbi:glycosyl transferase [Microbacterium sp. Gd 4-13]|uniref:glycosyltransferase n=1 Tax=Microbacterium sp. Gd 4-13 TaxID=2173179 RepID=UPI000D578D3E|nr:glycosyltransferase [Microbacterium sp. Gd 4-13]PVW06110.1 glycosyl transferase [Microbacterium sp. Gd 4-13]
MPSRVHAILVVRPEGRTPAAAHLKRTIDALRAQTQPVDALTIVLCGGDAALTEIAAASGAEGVITAPHSTGFAAATALATPRLTGDAVWLLAQDTAPEPQALTRLAGALELAPSLAMVAPKLVRWDDRTEIVSLGVSMSGFGRSVELAADELDQGQHDAAADVLGSDIRGVLVRREDWRVLGGLDPALAGADEGLDLGVRARLAGDLVTVVPSARVAVAGDGVASLPEGHRASRRAFAVRTAELHRRLSYAPGFAVPLHWLSLLPLAIWRTIMHLVSKEPGRVWPEWLATLRVLVRLDHVARARGRIRAVRRVGWPRLASLRVSRTQLRLRLDGDAEPTAPVRSDLRFFTGGAAWVVLGAILVSVAAFPTLLAWPALGGGALAPMQDTVARLWADAGFGQRSVGLAEIGPADPFSAVIALLGTLWPFAPARAMVLLWLAALPLAVLGAWFASTRVTERSSLRLTAAVAWALAPTFLAALSEGRAAGVLVHLLLPWLFYTASVAHRSWAAAGAASLLLVAVIACSPSLAPAFVLLWSATLLLAALVTRGRGLGQIVWLFVPSVVAFAPLVWHQVRVGNPWALLADPGVPYAGGTVAADAVGRFFLATGFPLSDPGGWSSLLAGAPTWWVPLLAAPIAVLALLAVLTPRWVSGAALLVIAGAGLATAFAAIGVAVSFVDATAVAIWPGAALSLAWLGAIGAAMVTLDAGVVNRMRVVRPVAAVLALAALAVAAVPVLTLSFRNELALTNGPASTLPAYVAAEGRDDARLGTLVLDPDDTGLHVRVVWGGSETLGGQSTVISTRDVVDASDREVADLAASLVTSSAGDAVSGLATRGIAFVLLTPGDPATADAAATLQLSASTALDQLGGLDTVGETSRGTLWRVTEAIAPRAEPSRMTRDTALLIAGVQIGVVVIALLLAIPTTASRGTARRSPRIVGPTPGETR